MRWREADATLDEEATAADRIVAEVVGTTRALRDNELFVRIVELDPELLLPYLLTRRGRSQEAIAEHTAGRLREGQPDGSVRNGRPGRDRPGPAPRRPRVRPERPHDGRRRGRRGRPRPRARAPRPERGRAMTRIRAGPGRRTHRGRRARRRARHHRRRLCPRRRLARPVGAGRRRPRPGLRYVALVEQAGPRRPALPRQRPARRGPRERRRARHPDGGHRPPPDPRAADAPTPRRGHRPSTSRVPAHRDRRRRPAPRRRADLTRNPSSTSPDLRHRDPSPGAGPGLRASAAASCRGTASSRTTPGWSPRSRAPPPPSAPRSVPALAPSSSTAAVPCSATS